MNKEKSKYQEAILQITGARPIALNPALARYFKSIKAGLFLSELLYWQKQNEYQDWIYKTIQEIKDTTSLSRAEQDTAIAICKEKGILEVKVSGLPAKRHFKIDVEKLADDLEKF